MAKVVKAAKVTKEKKEPEKKAAPPPTSPGKPRIELHAALIFGVGLFLLGSLYYIGEPADRELIGVIGTFIAQKLCGLFGDGAVLLTTVILIWSLYIFWKREYWDSRLTGVALFFAATLVFYSIDLLQEGKDYWLQYHEGYGGGLIGAGITYLLKKLLGYIGTKIIMYLSYVVALVLIINKPLLELVMIMWEGLKQLEKAFEEMIFVNNGDEERKPKDGAKDKEKDKEAAKEPHHEPIIVAGPINRGPFEQPTLPIVEETPDSQEPIKATKTRRKQNLEDSYQRPGLDLLVFSETDRGFNKSDIKESIKVLEDTFSNFGISIKVNQVSCGPAVTRYELQPAPGVKVSKILNLADDLQLSLAAKGIRIEAPIPGKSAVGIEVPNEKVSRVGLRSLLSSSVFVDSPHPLTVALGEDISGSPIAANLADMPHLLIAGATGSGKSVCLNSLILSLLYKSSPEDLKLVLIDPKMVELTVFNGIPHLMSPVVTDPKKASLILRWMNTEMEKRYKRFSQEGVRDIYRFNEISAERLPFIVIIIDELADLMMVSPVEVEDSICRLAQMARAAGIHLVVATQRPSVDVVTGIIKANIPSRIAFAVSSQTDSRTILDTSGAEKLLGRGDMLFYPVGASKPLRVQGAFVTDNETERVVEFLKSQVTSEELEEMKEFEAGVSSETYESDDELFWDAARVFVESQKASVSLLQRKLRIGYARAARLVDIMEERGIISEPDNYKKREILIDEDQLEKLVSRNNM
ncbi:MAG: DNA translocase FtsK 4TM domain-containing protein [Candidatus Saccharibacteria bacterium]